MKKENNYFELYGKKYSLKIKNHKEYHLFVIHSLIRESEESVCGKVFSDDEEVEEFLTGLKEQEARNLCSKIGNHVCSDCIKNLYTNPFYEMVSNFHLSSSLLFDEDKINETFAIKINSNSGVFHVFNEQSKKAACGIIGSTLTDRFHDLNLEQIRIKCAEIGRDVCANCISSLYPSFTNEAKHIFSDKTK
jgi:hypothetical protein